MSSARCLVCLAVAICAFANAARADFNSLTLPRAFQKNIPESVKDLQDIEAHVKKLLDKVIPATVGLQIGGSSGSGVIINKEGHILTAGHVSGKPDQDVRIILHDGRKIKGKTLGGNRAIDSGMAIITDKGEYPFVDMAKITDVRKGHWCLAVGHPNGYLTGRSPVLRVGRVLEMNKGYLRSDCTLVGGDSGGPLFDMHGNVIGIHSRIGNPITANIHVPIDTYQETWDKLAKAEIWGDNIFGAGPKGKGGKGGPKKTEDEPYLGVRPGADAKEFKIEVVQPDSPAAKAGLKPGDVLLALDGKKFATSEELDKLLRTQKPGNVVALEYRRGDAQFNTKVTLSKRPG